MNDYDLELFDYPLNIELPEDAVYQDTTIPEGSFTWLYTTVKPDFAFPKEIPYEVAIFRQKMKQSHPLAGVL